MNKINSLNIKQRESNNKDKKDNKDNKDNKNNKKNNKNNNQTNKNTGSKTIFIILAIIILAVFIFAIRNTLAKYLTEVTGEVTTDIAQWQISVNNVDVTTGKDISNTIQPVLPGNEHIKPGVMAPTAEGYFDLNLNYSNVDVSFQYELKIAPTDTSIVPDLKLTGYSIDGSNEIISVNTDTITKEVLITETKRTEILRIYFKWDDDITTETMDNLQDTETTIYPDNKATINADITFTQLANVNTP